MANDKKIYWLVKSNGDLSVTVKDISEAKELIENDFEYEREDGIFDIEDLQYTITPIQMTEEEFSELPEFNG